MTGGESARIRAFSGDRNSVTNPQAAARTAVSWHGQSIRRFDPRDGLQKRQRHDVHLSESIEATMKVGQRRGVAVLVTIRAGENVADGFKFYTTPNNVWLTDSVPVKYLSVEDEDGDGRR